MMTERILDIAKLSISEEGIDHFYWPIQSNEIYLLYLHLLDRLIHYIRQTKKKKIPGSDSAIILYHFFIFDVMSTYEAHLLLSRSKNDLIIWKNTEINPWVSVIRQNKTPDTSFIIRRLKQGPVPLSKRRAPMRFMRDLLVSRKEGMIRRSLHACNYAKNIVSLTLNPLAIQHVKSISDHVYYYREQFWFKKPKSVNSKETYSDLISGFLQCVSDVFERLPEQLSLYYQLWLEEAIPLSEAYLQQLECNNIRVKRLWVGTASHLWGRILARYVRKNAGHVTRFDHGSGCAYFSDSHAHGAHDYEDCDTYMTFSKNQAETMKTAFIGTEVVQHYCPNMTVAAKKLTPAPINKPKTSLVINKIMYVASIYPNGHFYSGAKGFMRNHVLLDWEIRLMAQLKKWGYELLFKPHPTEDICLEPPKSIERLFGPITLKQRFEDVVERADLVILDDPTTSLLKTLTQSNKPFVYLDFGVADFSIQALQLLKKRCSIVIGEYDDSNRAIIDWSKLKEAIEHAWNYNDKHFYNYYF